MWVRCLRLLARWSNGHGRSSTSRAAIRGIRSDGRGYPQPHRQRGFNGDVAHAHEVRSCDVGNTLLSLTSSFRFEGRSWSQVGCGSAAPQVPLMDKREFYFWSSHWKLPRGRGQHPDTPPPQKIAGELHCGLRFAIDSQKASFR